MMGHVRYRSCLKGSWRSVFRHYNHVQGKNNTNFKDFQFHNLWACLMLCIVPWCRVSCSFVGQIIWEKCLEKSSDFWTILFNCERAINFYIGNLDTLWNFTDIFPFLYFHNAVPLSYKLGIHVRKPSCSCGRSGIFFSEVWLLATFSEREAQ